MNILILIEMIFLHIIADYFLQGILANMKCKGWWMRKTTNEQPNKKYENDYKAALIAHSFEWTFIIMLPMFHQCYKREYMWVYAFSYIIMFVINTAFHYVIDDWKANKHSINLIQDQLLHALQIFVTWAMWTAIIGWYI